MKNISEIIWKNVDNLLIKKKMTLTALAEKMNMKISNLSPIRTGKVQTTRRTIKRLAKALGVEPEVFFIMPESFGGGVLISKDVIRIYPMARGIIERLNSKATEGLAAAELIEWLIHQLESELVEQRSRDRRKRIKSVIPIRKITKT